MDRCPACQQPSLAGTWRCSACGASLIPRPQSTTTASPVSDRNQALTGLGLDLLWSLGAAALVVLVVCLAADGCKGLVWLRAGAVFAGIMAALGMTWRQTSVRSELISAILAVVVTLSAIYTAHWLVVNRGMSAARQTLADVRLQARHTELIGAVGHTPTPADRRLEKQMEQSLDFLLGEFSWNIVHHLIWKNGWGAISTLCGLTIAFFLTRERALR